ncbi:MAG: transaldolase family protein [Chlamydiales bacterium]
MELWIDTIDRKVIERVKELGLLYGVTTNPSILARVNLPAEEILEDLLNHFPGPLAVQVTLSSASEIIDQGRDLYDFSPRIIVKIPVTEAGIEAIFRLNHNQIPTMATAVLTPLHAFLAAKAGARYIAVYFSHLGQQAVERAVSIQHTLKANGCNSKLLIASLKNREQVEQCIMQGFPAMTLNPDLFRQCLEPSKEMLQTLDAFEADWSKASPSNLLTTRQFIG